MSRTLNLPNLFISPEPPLLSPRSPSPTSVRFPSPTVRLPSPTVKAFTATEAPPRRRTAGSKSNSNSLYEVLRVKRNASQTEIKTAYRNLAKVYHPDTSSCSESEFDDGLDFIAIHNAYATLSDPAARAKYDLSLGPQYSPSAYSYSFSSGGLGLGFCPTRRWETDQCW
ncbi:Chaperone protein dnaJ 11 [Morus notabilis]|uniref:Chaperone protein dnaJ 11 n=1 Tax=Morus notabilis TaxID=981085 RepID=W9QR47_9ROSA|nr:chaperone protein dnaJ 11, chloroplastic [Morus notabilis]EXB51056.1 Chaperone protein dnaJ 11 [Morus notabilis]